MIDDKDLSESTLRFIIWEALKNYPTDELLNLIEDEDPIVRTSAAKQLHFRPNKKVFEKSINLVSSKKDYEREIGAFLLGQLGTPNHPYKMQSFSYLVRLMSDASSEVRASAVAAIGHLGANTPIDDNNILNCVIQLAKDKCSDVRFCCAFALASFNSDDARKVLNDLIADHCKIVRDWAKISLEIIDERQAPRSD